MAFSKYRMSSFTFGRVNGICRKIQYFYGEIFSHFSQMVVLKIFLSQPIIDLKKLIFFYLT